MRSNPPISLKTTHSLCSVIIITNYCCLEKLLGITIKEKKRTSKRRFNSKIKCSIKCTKVLNKITIMARIGDLDIAMTIHHFKVVFTKFFDCMYFEHWTGSMSNWVKYKNGRPMADIKSHINNKKYSRTKKKILQKSIPTKAIF